MQIVTSRFVLEQERPDGWIADAYLAPVICLPLLVIVLGMMIVGTTYRSAPFDRDRLWRVAENPSAATQDRLASFIALRARATDGDVKRLRESTDRMVDRKTAQRLLRATTLVQDEELVDVLELHGDDDAALSLPEKLRRRRVI